MWNTGGFKPEVEAKPEKVDNSVCSTHGCKMTLLYNGYICDICDPPKNVEPPPNHRHLAKTIGRASFPNAPVTPRITIKGTKTVVTGTTWYVYSTKDYKTEVDGYKVYDDLSYLKGKCVKKAAQKGCKYYIYELSGEPDEICIDYSSTRPTVQDETEVELVWETP